MIRLFLSDIPCAGQDALFTDPDELHHALHVLRLKEGADIEFIDGKGTLAKGVVKQVSPRQIVVRLIERTSVPPRQKGRITLACAIPRKAKFETILEKVTELGVDEIIPMVTERTEVRPVRAGEKKDRFEKILLNASKQCKRLSFPVLHPVSVFDDVIRDFLSPDVTCLFPWLEGERLSLKEAFKKAPEGGHFLVFIGPEGDFSPREADLALGKGAIPVTLGDNTLKVDTAAMAVVGGIRFLSF